MQAFELQRHQARRLQDARHNGDEQEGAVGVSRGKIRKEAAKVTRLKNSPRDTRYFLHLAKRMTRPKVELRVKEALSPDTQPFCLRPCSKVLKYDGQAAMSANQKYSSSKILFSNSYSKSCIQIQLLFQAKVRSVGDSDFRVQLAEQNWEMHI